MRVRVRYADSSGPAAVRSVGALARAWKRAPEIVREGGIRALWFTVLGELCYRRAEIREHVLDDSSENDRCPALISIDRLSPADIEEYNAFRKPRDLKSAQQRMNAGHHCFVARHSGQIVAAWWGATSNASSWYLSSPIDVASDEVYAYDLFTAPEWRRQGIATALTTAVHNFYRAAGKRRVIRLIVPENKAAKAHAMRYECIGRMGFVGVGRFRVKFCRMKTGKIPPGGASV